MPHRPRQRHPRIIAAVSALIARQGGNIVAFDQYSDGTRGGAYFQRVVFHRPDLAASLPEIQADLHRTLRDGFELEWKLTDLATPKRMAILASKQDHCLLDLLWRHRRGDLPVSIPMVVSNHTTSADDVRSFGVPFFHVPSTPGPDKSASEARILELLVGNVDFVVLARYMQILSPEFLEKIGVPVINIHHSFLPAFIGAEPYKKAKERGVKLIGATSHYVTGDLDEGRSSSRTRSASPTPTRPPSSRAAVPTSSARCSREPCCGTPRTASSATATTPSSSRRSPTGAGPDAETASA